MKTRLAALLLPLAALAACRADNNGSVRIQAICAAPDATSCTFTSTCTAQHIGSTVVDVSLPTPRLVLPVEVDNLMPDNGNKDLSRTNTNDAFVQEIEVEYAGVALPTVTAPIEGSATVPANGTAVISIVPVPPATGAALAALGIPGSGSLSFIAKVKLKGQLADTTKFETGIFQVPVMACNGCLAVAPYTATCAAPKVPVYCPAGQPQLPGSAGCAGQ